MGDSCLASLRDCWSSPYRHGIFGPPNSAAMTGEKGTECHKAAAVGILPRAVAEHSWSLISKLRNGTHGAKAFLCVPMPPSLPHQFVTNCGALAGRLQGAADNDPLSSSESKAHWQFSFKDRLRRSTAARWRLIARNVPSGTSELLKHQSF